MSKYAKTYLVRFTKKEYDHAKRMSKLENKSLAKWINSRLFELDLLGLFSEDEWKQMADYIEDELYVTDISRPMMLRMFVMHHLNN